MINQPQKLNNFSTFLKTDPKNLPSCSFSSLSTLPDLRAGPVSNYVIGSDCRQDFRCLWQYKESAIKPEFAQNPRAKRLTLTRRPRDFSADGERLRVSWLSKSKGQLQFSVWEHQTGWCRRAATAGTPSRHHGSDAHISDASCKVTQWHLALRMHLPGQFKEHPPPSQCCQRHNAWERLRFQRREAQILLRANWTLLIKQIYISTSEKTVCSYVNGSSSKEKSQHLVGLMEDHKITLLDNLCLGYLLDEIK